MGIKKMKWNDVTMVSTVKEMLNLAVEEAGDSLAFQYKDETNKDNIISPWQAKVQTYNISCYG